MRVMLFLLLVLISPFAWAEAGFVRISQAEELTENGEYIIGALNHNPNYDALFYLYTGADGNYYSQDMPERLPSDCGGLRFQVVADGEGWALKTSDGFVFYPGSGTALKTSAVEPSVWTLTEQGGGEFALSVDGRYLKLSCNTKNVGRFGAYAASNAYPESDRVCIYKRTFAPEEMTSYERFLSAGTSECETLCLPFDCSLPAGFSAYEIAERKTNSLVYGPDVTDQLLAGHAYVIVAAHSKLLHLEKKPDSRSAEPYAGGVLRGTYKPLHVSSGLLLNGRAFVSAAAGALVPAFRAYIPE